MIPWPWSLVVPKDKIVVLDRLILALALRAKSLVLTLALGLKSLLTFLLGPVTCVL